MTAVLPTWQFQDDCQQMGETLPTAPTPRIEEFLEQDFRVLPLAALGKEPHTCNRHAPCRQFLRGAESATKNEGHLLAVLALHPDLNLGLVPGDTMVVVDLDAWKGEPGEAASKRIIDAVQAVHPHYVVLTPRGGRHYYLRRSAMEQYRSIEAVDLRYENNGYVAAPGSILLDPATGQWGEYRVWDGIWGEFQVDRGIEGLFQPPADAPSAGAKVTIGPSARVGDAATERALLRLDTLLKEYAGTGNPEDRSSWNGLRWRVRTDASFSADLCAVWNVCHWSGLTVEQAVDLVITYRPVLAGERADRPRSWLISNATNVYSTATNQLGQPLRRRVFSTADLDQLRGRLHDVLAYAVDMANVSQSELVYLGTQAVADHFQVSRSLAGRWLRALVDRGLLTIQKEYRYLGEDDPRNRVRVYSIRNLRASAAPDPRIVTKDTTEAAPMHGDYPGVETKGNHEAHPPSNPRIKQVAELTAMGLTNTEIAHEVGVSIRTVQDLRRQGVELSQYQVSDESEQAAEPAEGPDHAADDAHLAPRDVVLAAFNLPNSATPAKSYGLQGPIRSAQGAQGAPHGCPDDNSYAENVTGAQGDFF